MNNKPNLLDSVVITPRAVARWQDICRQMRMINDVLGVYQVSNEQAEKLDGGRLRIWVEMSDASKPVEMVLEPDDWAMAN